VRGTSRRGVGRRGRVALVLLLTAAAGCGEAKPDAVRAVAPAATLPERTIRILDPSGRLHLHPSGLEVHAIRSDGALTPLPRAPSFTIFDDLPVFDATDVPPNGEVVVFAHGCRVERTRVPAGAETIVRLRRGWPVRIRVRWDGRLPEGWTQLGIALRSTPSPGDLAGRAGASHGAIGSDWMDRDLPAKPTWTPIRSADAELLLYVPEPGDYDVEWKLDTPRAGLGIGDRKRLTVGAAEPPSDVPVELVLPEGLHEMAEKAGRR